MCWRGIFLDTECRVTMRGSIEKSAHRKGERSNGVSAVLHLPAVLIKRRIERVEILTVKMLLRDAECLAKALIMHDLSFAQIFNGIAHVGIVAQTQNIVVGDTSLLLC